MHPYDCQSWQRLYRMPTSFWHSSCWAGRMPWAILSEAKDLEACVTEAFIHLNPTSLAYRIYPFSRHRCLVATVFCGPNIWKRTAAPPWAFVPKLYNSSSLRISLYKSCSNPFIIFSALILYSNGQVISPYFPPEKTMTNAYLMSQASVQ